MREEDDKSAKQPGGGKMRGSIPRLATINIFNLTILIIQSLWLVMSRMA